MALRQLVAQRMAVRQGVGIGKATGQLGRGALASQQRQRSSGSQEVAALHSGARQGGAGRQSAQRWRISNSCGTSGKKCSTSVGSKCCPASDWMSAQACSVGQAFL